MADDRNERDDRPKAEYRMDIEFDDPSGLVVQVNRREGTIPQFSRVVGMKRTNRDGHDILSKFLPAIDLSKQRGKVEIQPTASIVFALMQKADEYIQYEKQHALDTHIERQQAFEARQMNKDKPKPQKGLSGGPGSGKTQRRREAKRLAQLQAKSSS